MKTNQKTNEKSGYSIFSTVFKVVNSEKVLIEMIPVEGGTFMMGATAEQGKAADDDEYPVHKVTVSSVAIGKYPVTQALWIAVMGKCPPYVTDAPNCPVAYVSWNECQEFISKLNAKLGLSDAGKKFRFPTEAEWEFAARGGKKSRGYVYSGSDNIDEVAWHPMSLFDFSEDHTHPVGQKKPNELGIYDMSGNVWEWCGDRYGAYSSKSQTNPKRSGFLNRKRVLRGGNGGDCFPDQFCRVSCRISCHSDKAFIMFGQAGLRLVFAE